MFRRVAVALRRVPFARAASVATTVATAVAVVATEGVRFAPRAHVLADVQSEGDATLIELIAKADALYASNSGPRELYQLLAREVTRLGPQSAAVQAALLWRLARAEHDLALSVADVKEKEWLVAAAHEHAKRALALDPTNFACHKWAGISLSALGDFAGTKQKIGDAFVIREHFENAVKHNPRDPTSEHLLGLWCFTFADMGFVMHQAASMMFATPPTCTYDKALGHFARAEELESGFYKKNLVMLATTQQRLGKLADAKVTIKRALAVPVMNADDKSAHDDALKLAATLGLAV